MVGDLTGAQAYASTAKCLNIWALILGIIMTILLIIIPILILRAYQENSFRSEVGGPVTCQLSVKSWARIQLSDGELAFPRPPALLAWNEPFLNRQLSKHSGSSRPGYV
ncbi:hypothetical protein P7K49_032198 [Saguinus oedipus]|uniref:Uncharacterized protein n=1 Tax=Saguinus oedipus TaxID=9490 RepID=A0ABQ9TXL2_SAGOE|nr:hypothetical protein P7K49_032198 [Saguinus oedipus]